MTEGRAGLVRAAGRFASGAALALVLIASMQRSTEKRSAAASWGSPGVAVAVLPFATGGALLLCLGAAAERSGGDGKGKARADALLLSATWGTVLVLTWRPGTIVSDSFDQVEQALAGAYNIQHSPAFSALLGAVVRFAGSPEPIFLAQVVAIPLSLGLLLPLRQRPAASLSLLALFLWIPMTWTIATFVGKDGALAVALLVAVALAARGRPLASLALLVVASSLRHNAILATLPLAAYASLEATRPLARRGVRALAACALAALPLFADAAQVRLSRAREWPLAFFLQAWDLTAIYMEHPGEYDASLLAKQARPDDLFRAFSPLLCDTVFTVPTAPGVAPGPRLLDPIALAKQSAELRDEWLRTIVRHPLTWARWRSRVFLGQLGVPYLSGPTLPNRWGWNEDTGSPMWLSLQRAREKNKERFFSLGGCWFAGLLLLGGVLVARGRWRGLAFAVSVSGLLYALGYAVFGPAIDARYLFWSWFALASAAALALGEAPARPLPAGSPPVGYDPEAECGTSSPTASSSR